MAQTVIISFSDPQLMPGEKFRISYENLTTGNTYSIPDKTDNSDLSLYLNEGTYRFYIRLVKANGTLCPESTIDYTVFPPPTEPVDPNDPDPPITTNQPCYCFTISNVVVKEDCNGLKTLNMDVAYPATNQSCVTKIWVRYATSGAGSNPVLHSFNGQPATVVIPLSSTSFVQYRSGLYCCSDNTQGYCNDWQTVTDKEDCSCTVPGISVLNFNNVSQNNVIMTIDIAPSVPSLPPYEVSIIVGIPLYTQSYNSSGQQIFNVPYGFTNAILRVSNQCGHSEIPIVTEWCVAPVVTVLNRITSSNQVQVEWSGANGGNYLVELIRKNGTVAYSQTVSVLANSYNFSVSSSFMNESMIQARVTNRCGMGIKENIL